MKELLQMEGTCSKTYTNIIIATERNWTDILERNPLANAYYHRGDPAYKQLYELFALNNVKEEHEGTVIVLSDSLENEDNAYALAEKNAPPDDLSEVNSNRQFSHARRKLMFDEGYPMDLESTNKKVGCFYIPGANGKLKKRIEKTIKSRQLPQEITPKGPTYSSSCASYNPITWWKLPHKPNI
ncbi:hypothetical protein AAHA92_33375 [Salvia divinorum]|uniref:Uncharacterized protein n=1 Tax=Salvia divinorum TaxID=28513 RepID=A0ABD1FNS1_SALDI